MFKKSMVVFCVLALALSVFFVPAAAQNDENVFQAGYALVDINPYWSVWTAATGEAVPNGYSETNIMPLPMDGYSNGLDRLAEPTLTDDNGDGKVGAGDGLQATCIALHDGNQTLLLIAVDMLRIDDSWGYPAREMISDATGIPVSNIMLSASHTHGGVNMDVSFEKIQENRYTVSGSGDTYTGHQLGRYRDAYVDYVKEQMVNVAVAAINDKVDVSAQRGTINANTQSGEHLNGVRHYKLTDSNGVEYVAGPNFNGSVHTGDIPVFEGNQQLHVLEFVPENGGEPIVLVNWRAHTNTGSKSKNHYLSSDYVGSMRKTLSNAGYQASFYLGAAGNHGNFNGVNENEAWYYASDYAQRSVTYGTTLASVALALLENENVKSGAMVAEMENVATGEIRVNHIAEHRFDGNHVNTVQALAAQAHNNKSGCSNSGKYPCVHSVKNDAGEYEKYVIASGYHADTILSRSNYKPVNSWGVTGEINVLTIGSELAFVTAPFELFDRYSNEATLETANDYNDWDILAGMGYGTPFVFTCTNEHWGYVSNRLGYNYNTDSAHYGIYAVGSYEAQTGYLAEGSGEQLIRLYAQMLQQLSYVSDRCDACGAPDAQWLPLTAELLENNQNALAAGHYFLDGDLEIDSAIAISGANVCLNLNGCSIRAVGTSRTIAISGEKTLNVLDTSEGKTGAIVGSAQCTEESGGNIYVNIGTLNLYSGTITGGHATKYGGNVFVYGGGTLNLYGGLVENGTVGAGGAGGNICGNGGNSTKQASNICLAGGMVRDGAIGQNTATVLANVYAQGNLILTGSSDWEEPVQLGIRSGTQITVRGTYTGKLNVWAASGVITDGAVFGSYEEGASVSGAQITVQGQPNLRLKLADGEVKFVEHIEVAKIGNTTYATLGEALAIGGTAQVPIVLLADADEPNTLVKTTYIDLNGYDVTNVTTGSYKLYVMDTATADYDVADGVYGKVTNADKPANVKAASGYMVEDNAGALSYHKFVMNLTDLVVNTEKVGITYKAAFYGDQYVKSQIAEFGVALRAYTAPNSTSIWVDQDRKTHVAMQQSDWKIGAGENGVKCVYVSGILDENVTTEMNSQRANVQIYGCTYVKLTDGTMLFGDVYNFSLKTAMQYMDDYWNTLDQGDQSALKDFYSQWKNVMSAWADIDNIKVVDLPA